ncbi:MAG: cyclic nucleotide-binding domain-containing protein [Candidatus Abyssobacteria bacterium SURF_5]|uniref:Cyclic nucleotide-binding domain-containing protein n=1 Tax=Abyssobacteria bacterium (strain SURF_5) TaxID=2093360 RepID=A0A3A4NR75_ABYX5|nr:MAG: cyclic nucleotide-binding domain-containing protein [Candidatus Abyssubacteria bacterium SURF_5]
MDQLVKIYQESEKLRALQVNYLPQEIVFSEGENTSEMYILLSGKVEILKDDKRIAVVEEEGSYLGELSTLLGIPRSATVKTMSSCQFLVVGSEKVTDFLASSPALGLKLARMLAERLVRMNMDHVRLERKIDLMMERLRDANDRLQKRDKQVEQLVARLEKLQHLQS